MTEEEEIADPECNNERWWELAERHPLEAQASALYWMLTLESPERWEKLQRQNIGNWVEEATERLPFRERELFAADCAERVLPIYERAYPGASCVREAIEVRRCYALGQTSKEAWEDARQYTARVAFFAEGQARYVVDAALINRAAVAGFFAAFAIDSANSAESSTVCYAEQIWQWERVQQYARGEVQ